MSDSAKAAASTAASAYLTGGASLLPGMESLGGAGGLTGGTATGGTTGSVDIGFGNINFGGTGSDWVQWLVIGVIALALLVLVFFLLR